MQGCQVGYFIAIFAINGCVKCVDKNLLIAHCLKVIRVVLLVFLA